MNDEQRAAAYKIDAFKRLLQDAYYASKKSVNVLLKDSYDFNMQLIAQMHLSNTTSIVCAVKSVYISNFEILERDEIDAVFHQFDVFKNEFLNNITTYHSHQWTNIEYNEFLRRLDNLGIGVPIELDD